MNMKHTPGPWKVHTDSQLHGEYTLYTGPSKDDSDAIVCEVAGGLGAYDEGCCESEANARLIAAAPDLLAALELCITSEGAACFSDMNSHPEYMQRRLYAISDLARAAIAKATGEG